MPVTARVIETISIQGHCSCEATGIPGLSRSFTLSAASGFAAWPDPSSSVMWTSGYGSEGAAVFTGSITPSDYPVRSVLIDGRPSAQLSGTQAGPICSKCRRWISRESR